MDGRIWGFITWSFAFTVVLTFIVLGVDVKGRFIEMVIPTLFGVALLNLILGIFGEDF